MSMDNKTHHPRHRPLFLAVAVCLFTGGLLATSGALAQSAPATPTPQDQSAPEVLAPQDQNPPMYILQEPRSTQPGQTPLSDSFGPKTHEDWVSDTRRQAWEDTKFTIQGRSYLLDRDKYDGSESSAWALGGSAGMETGYFRNFFAFGGTVYTSQKLYGPDDKDGTLLLQPGQKGYTVLGQIYGEFLLQKDTRLTIGRRQFETPYINSNDVRMTPNTFQAATVQGIYGGDDGAGLWKVGGGYFDKIKERNSDEFVSMAQDAGAAKGVHRGVYTLGANYALGDLSIGAINYYSEDIINIFYTEGKYAFPLGEEWKLKAALQYTDEGSTGQDLLKGNSFNSNQWGTKVELVHGGALFTAAYTQAGGNANMQNPWSGSPSYTSVQVEDFNRDGEKAWMLRAGYDFQSVKGLGVSALYVNGSNPDSPTEHSRNETDFNVQWKVAEGWGKGFMLRLRYAQVSQSDPASEDLKDLRFMVYYDVQNL